MKSLYYKEEGDGPVLVLLHGFCETHEIWEEIIPELSIHSRIIAPDLPGFGKSEILPTVTIREVGMSVIRFLTAIEVQNCVIIGHSLGGYVALAIAVERPDLIAGLCLFHSTALPDTEEKKLNRGRVMDFVRKNGVLPFIETFVPGLFFQKNMKKNLEQVYKIAAKTDENTLLCYTRAMRDRPDMTGFLSEFEKPILFLAGEKDTFIEVSSLADQVKISVNGQLKVLAETGHMGMFEATNESIKILKDFSRACFYPMAP